MKRFFVILMTIVMLSLTACDSDDVELVSVNVEGIQTTQQQPQPPIGVKALVEIGDSLWYDQSTRVVYFWNGILVGYRSDTVPSPYYASNGLPYLYNPETSTFELIEE